jgi:hypothetical protein
MIAPARSARPMTPPATPPAIAAMCLCDCDTVMPLALDVLAAAGAAVGVVELGPVGGGRRVRLEGDLVVEGPGLLDENELELRDVEDVDEEVSDEAVALVGNGSMPFTAQAQIGGDVACCAPQAKPVHVLAVESGWNWYVYRVHSGAELGLQRGIPVSQIAVVNTSGCTYQTSPDDVHDPVQDA